MHRRRVIGVLAAIVAVVPAAFSSPVDLSTASRVAAAVAGTERTVGGIGPHPSGGTPLFFVAELEPAGFVVVAADDRLPPVIGYAVDGIAPAAGDAAEAIRSLLAADLATRLAQVPRLPDERLTERRAAWRRLLSGEEVRRSPASQVWPPPGSTPTGGWVTTQWSQGAPYNAKCPLDPVTGVRSVAGCPAVAMAQVVNRHRHHHWTALDDGDDYWHAYSGRTYWIDDDHLAHGFPSFPELSVSLDGLEQTWAAGGDATDDRVAALVFASGVALRQVYTSSVSGTFGVGQAVDAFFRFGELDIELLDDTDPDLYLRLAEEMRRGRPAHLAVVNDAGTSGHNLVIDGYDGGDGRFHLNFGWGGAYDGWYLLPDEIPYGLTVIDGVIVGIAFFLARDGFETGTLDGWSSAAP